MYISRREAIEHERTRLETEIERTRQDFAKSTEGVLYHLASYLNEYKQEAIVFSVKFLEQLANTNLVDNNLIESLIKQLQAIHNLDNFTLDLNKIIQVVVSEVTLDYVDNSEYQEDDETISHFESRYRQANVNLHKFMRHL